MPIFKSVCKVTILSVCLFLITNLECIAFPEAGIKKIELLTQPIEKPSFVFTSQGFRFVVAMENFINYYDSDPLKQEDPSRRAVRFALVKYQIRKWIAEDKKQIDLGELNLRPTGIGALRKAFEDGLVYMKEVSSDGVVESIYLEHKDYDTSGDWIIKSEDGREIMRGMSWIS